MLRGRWTLVALAGLLLATTAHAQDTGLDLLGARIGPDDLPGLARPTPLPKGRLAASLQLSYANDLVVGDRVLGPLARPAEHRFQSELGVAYGLLERLQLGAVLPVVLRQTGRDYPRPGDRSSAAGLGDLRLLAKLRLLGGAPADPLGLALEGVLGATTHGDDDWLGEAGPWAELRLLAERPGGRGPSLLAALGYRRRAPTRLMDLRIADQVQATAAAEQALGRLGLSLFAELNTSLILGSEGGDDPALGSRRWALEGLGGLQWRSCEGPSVLAGLGQGLLQGLGAPDLRALVSLVWGPSAECGRERAARARQDAAQREALEQARAGEQERQEAAVAAALAARRREEAEAARPENQARWVAADPDPDGDGATAPLDQCPNEPEDRDGNADEDGCPDPDDDADGIPDATDRCPREAEVINGVDDEDGCPDEGLAQVRLGRGELEISERVYFERGSDRLEARSKGLLRQVAQTLLAHRELQRVEIQGHTDAEGDPEQNVDLSERRARQVMLFLVEAGVPGKRLEARGFGPARPVADNESAAGRARNRRVEFHIVDPPLPSSEAGSPAAAPSPAPPPPDLGASGATSGARGGQQ